MQLMRLTLKFYAMLHMKDGSFESARAMQKPGKFLCVFILDVKHKKEHHNGLPHVRRWNPDVKTVFFMQITLKKSKH